MRISRFFKSLALTGLVAFAAAASAQKTQLLVYTALETDQLKAYQEAFNKVEPNIEAGSKYMRILIDQYFPDLADDPFNATMFAFAAYNAGPTRLAKLRRAAPKAGLDPKVWFDNVELLMADQVGREPVDYVRNIFKYYVAYRLLTRQLDAKRSMKAESTE